MQRVLCFHIEGNAASFGVIVSFEELMGVPNSKILARRSKLLDD